MATTLTEFLLARIAEDEAANDAAVRAEVESCRADGMPDLTEAEVREYWADQHWWKRRLAECEAKRRIVGAFEEERVRRDIYNRDFDSGEYDFNDNDLRARLASNAHCRGLEIAMLALALPYADHPDCRAEWRP